MSAELRDDISGRDYTRVSWEHFLHQTLVHRGIGIGAAIIHDVELEVFITCVQRCRKDDSTRCDSEHHQGVNLLCPKYKCKVCTCERADSGLGHDDVIGFRGNFLTLTRGEGIMAVSRRYAIIRACSPDRASPG